MKKRSRSGDAEDRSRRKSLARNAKKPVAYSEEKLDDQKKDKHGNYTFPKDTHESSTEPSENTDHEESEEELELHQRKRS